MQVEEKEKIVQDIKIEEIIDIAHEAGKAVLDIYKRTFSVELKMDHSPLTEADKRSNEIVVSSLCRLYPGIPYISEESKHTPFEVRRNWEYFWLIDPLDGTKEFIKRNGEFTINIALIHMSTPVLGVIYVPDKDITYYARKGNGSFILDDSAAPRQIRSKPHPDSDKLVVVGSRSHASQDLHDFVKAREKEYKQVDLISQGSSLKFCLVAEGRADIYLRTGPTMEWDTAAGHAVVNESGKQVYLYDSGEVLSYNKSDLRNGWFIVR